MDDSSQGRDLAGRVIHDKLTPKGYRIAERPQNIDRVEKEQRYAIFIDKMLELYKNEKRLSRFRDNGLKAMELAPLQSTTPIRKILNEYSKLSQRGFDCETLQ